MDSISTDTVNDISEENKNIKKDKQLFNYLDKDILQIKTVQLDEILSTNITDKPQDEIDLGDLSNLKPNNIIKAKVVFKN